MTTRVARKLACVGTLLAFVLAAGCAGGPSLRSVSKPSESKRQYLGLKKIAVLPLNNIGGDKGADEQAMGIIVSELNISDIFEEIEDPHYVGSVLKALKLRKIDELDLEMVQKMGSEMNAQALLFGDIHAWGLGKGEAAAMHVSLTLTLMDTQTGKPLWIGNGARRASFTWSRTFGLNEGPDALEVAREVIVSMMKRMNDEISENREMELVRIKSEEESKLKAAAEAEKRRLEEMMEQEEGQDQEQAQ